MKYLIPLLLLITAVAVADTAIEKLYIGGGYEAGGITLYPNGDIDMAGDLNGATPGGGGIDLEPPTAGGLIQSDGAEWQAVTASEAITALDAELAAIASTTSATDTIPYYNGSGTATTTGFTSFARNLLDDADAATVLATLGINTKVLTPAAANLFPVSTGSAWSDSGTTLPLISTSSNTGLNIKANTTATTAYLQLQGRTSAGADQNLGVVRATSNAASADKSIVIGTGATPLTSMNSYTAYNSNGTTTIGGDVTFTGSVTISGVDRNWMDIIKPSDMTPYSGAVFGEATVPTLSAAGKTLELPHTSTPGLRAYIGMPRGFNGERLSVRVSWFTQSSTSGNLILQTRVRLFQDGTTLDTTAGTALTPDPVTIAVASSSGYKSYTTEFEGTLAGTANIARIQVARTQNASADTFEAPIFITAISVELDND